MLQELEPIANKLNEERGIIDIALGQLSDAEAAAIMVTPEWSVKDVAAHLAGAERGMTRIAQAIAREENPKLPEGYNNDTYNARQVAKRKDESLAQIRAELGTSRGELFNLIESATPAQLALRGEHPIYGDVSLKDLLVIIYSHEMSHWKEITDCVRQAKK